MNAAELKLSLPELSSISEQSLEHHLHITLNLLTKRMKDFLAHHYSMVTNLIGLAIENIENKLNFMLGKLKEKDTSFVPKLIKEIESMWTMGITLDCYRNLCNSMLKRIQQVLGAKEEVTKY
jgi:hypothetical protein